MSETKTRRKPKAKIDAKYPDIRVRLFGTNGNAFNLLSLVQRGMRESGVAGAEISAFFDEATSDDYDHLLRTCHRWVTVI